MLPNSVENALIILLKLIRINVYLLVTFNIKRIIVLIDVYNDLMKFYCYTTFSKKINVPQTQKCGYLFENSYCMLLFHLCYDRF